MSKKKKSFRYPNLCSPHSLSSAMKGNTML
jgi:hypothetical protein